MFDNLSYRLVRAIVRVLITLLGGIRVEGAHYVPVSGPAIMAPNHISVSDPPVVALGVTRPLYFMAKDELFRIPVLRTLIRALHAFPVRPDSADRSALQRAEKLLRAGEIVLVFPEGKMSETGMLQEFQPGVALLAVRTGAPVIPVFLENTDCLVPYGSVVPRRTPRLVIVKFGEPITLDDMDARSDRRQALQEGAARIRCAVAALSQGRQAV